jgi:hypothetical protein
VGTGTLYDRSFDIQYRLLDESEWLPAVDVGLRDFMGTGVLTSEYVVGTKTIGTNLRATGGISWGRMGSFNGFTNPLGALASAMETRPSRSSAFGVGGVPAYDLYFRGDAAFFGGVEWQINPSLTFAAEYSSDAYERKVANGTFEHCPSSYKMGHQSGLIIGGSGPPFLFYLLPIIASLTKARSISACCGAFEEERSVRSVVNNSLKARSSLSRSQELA